MFNFFKSNKQNIQSDNDVAMQKYQELVNAAHDKAMQDQKNQMRKAMMMGSAGSIGGGGGAGGSGGFAAMKMSPGTVTAGGTIHPIGTGTCNKCGYENDIKNTHCYLCNDKLNFKEILIKEHGRLKVDASIGRGWYGTSGTSA